MTNAQNALMQCAEDGIRAETDRIVDIVKRLTARIAQLESSEIDLHNRLSDALDRVAEQDSTIRGQQQIIDEMMQLNRPRVTR